MHYIRLLKDPSIQPVSEASSKKSKHSSKSHESSRDADALKTLVTITTDLGESFYPCDVDVDVELIFDLPETAGGGVLGSSGDGIAHGSPRREVS